MQALPRVARQSYLLMSAPTPPTPTPSGTSCRWTQATLEEHAGDPRPAVLPYQQLDCGASGDPFWDAATAGQYRCAFGGAMWACCACVCRGVWVAVLCIQMVNCGAACLLYGQSNVLGGREMSHLAALPQLRRAYHLPLTQGSCTAT